MCEGFNFKRNREQELFLLQLKTIRWAGWMQYAANPYKKKGVLMMPEELFPLPEFNPKERKIEVPTDEEMEWFKTWKK